MDYGMLLLITFFWGVAGLFFGFLFNSRTTPKGKYFALLIFVCGPVLWFTYLIAYVDDWLYNRKRDRRSGS